MPTFQIEGDLALNATGTDAATPTPLGQLRQRIRNWIGTPQGTYRYDLNAGLRYYWVAGPRQINLALQRAEILRGLKRMPGVIRVVPGKFSVTLDAVARELRVTFELQTEFGLLADDLKVSV